MIDLTLITELTKEEQATILNGLKNYAFEKANIKEEDCYIPFEFAYKDKEDNIVAGINGFCYYKCLYVDMLWVHSDCRHKKLGTALLNQAEVFGKEQGCLFSSLTTMDWEAPEFYKKLGYKVEFIREGYIHNHKMFFLCKKFS